MIVSVRTWFQALSDREKILIAVLLVLLFGFVAFYGIYRPFSSVINQAELRYLEAVERKGRIENKARLFESTAPNSDEDNPSASGSIEATVSQSVGEAGFATSAINTQSDGSVTMTIESAKPIALFRWIALIEQRGILVSEISINPSTNNAIRASITLR